MPGIIPCFSLKDVPKELRKSFNDLVNKDMPEQEQREIGKRLALDYHKKLHGELESLKREISPNPKKYVSEPYKAPEDKSEAIKEANDHYNKLIEEKKSIAPTENISSPLNKNSDGNSTSNNEQKGSESRKEADGSKTNEGGNENVQSGKKENVNEPANPLKEGAASEKGAVPSNEPPEPPKSDNSDAGSNKEGDGKFESVRKGKLKEIQGVKEMFEKRLPKKWSKVYESALENVQKLYPNKSLYEAMKARVNDFVLKLNNKELFNPTSEDIAVFTTLKAETQKRINQVEGQDSDNSIVRQTANAELSNLNNDLLDIARVTNPEGEAGRAFGIHQSEAMLDDNNGLKIRRMQLMRAKGDEKLTPEEEKWVNEKWDQEKELLKKEAEVREQGMREEFYNRISALEKEYEDKLKEVGKNTPKNATKKEKTLSQKGKDIADQIRKLKTNKGDINLDVTFGLRNLAIEAVAQIVEKGTTIAEAIKEVLKDAKFKGLSEKELSDHIIDGLSHKKDKSEELNKIKEFSKENDVTDITNEMVSKNLIRDYVNSHVGEVEKSKVMETAFKDLKEVLPNITKEKMIEAYLKEGEFKQPTKKQLDGGIKQQENELKRIAKSELTADQEQQIKLDAEKKNTEKKIKEFKKKLQDEDFDEPVPITLKKSDAELIRLKKEQSRVEEAYRKKQHEFQEKNKTGLERAADFARSAYVAILIGAPKTLAKVASMSLMRPLSEASTKLTFGKVFDKFFPGISKAALRGGESSSISSIQKGFEAYFRQMGNNKLESMYDKASTEFNTAQKAYYDYKGSSNPNPKKLEELKNNMNNKLIKAQSSFIYKFIGGSSLKDALNALVNRSNEIEKQFGKVEGESIKEGNWLDKTNYILGFIGRSHSAAKTFSGRFSFAAGFMSRLEGAVKNGEDISSPDKVLEIAHESYLDWERGKYQQSNQISDLWNKLTNHISEGETGTPREGASKVMAALLKTEVAITRVPVNILHEAVMEYTFGAFRALGMAAKNSKEIKDQLKSEGVTNAEGIAQGPSSIEFKAALRERISQMDEKQAATIARSFRKGGLGAGLYAFALISGAIHFGIFPHLGQKKKKDQEDLAEDELNPGQVMVGDTKLGEVTSGIIEHIPAFWTTFMGLGMAQAYNDEIKKGKTTTEAVQKSIYTHLKIIEGQIPQSKIISPTRVGETVVQSVKKKMTDAGILEPK